MENLRYLLNWRWPPGYQGDPAPLYYRRWREIYPEIEFAMDVKVTIETHGAIN